MRWRTRAHLERKRAEGKSRREAIRCCQDGARFQCVLGATLATVSAKGEGRESAFGEGAAVGLLRQSPTAW